MYHFAGMKAFFHVYSANVLVTELRVGLDNGVASNTQQAAI